MLTLLMFIFFCALLAAGLLWAGISVLYLMAVLAFKLVWLGACLLLGIGKGVFVVALLVLFFLLKLSGLLAFVAFLALGLFVVWAVSRLLGAGRRAPSCRQESNACGAEPRRPAAYQTPWDKDRAHVSALRTRFERFERRLANLEATLSNR